MATLQNQLNTTMAAAIDNETVPDGVITVPVESMHETATLLLLEVKNEIETGVSDPTTQGALSYVQCWAQERLKNFRLCCNCPSIILAVAGPWICVMGAIYLEKGVIDPLTTFIPLIPFHHHEYFMRTARLLESLRRAISSLKAFYKNLTTVDPDLQWFFPYPHQYEYDKKIMSFTYDEPLTDDSDKFIWKARTNDQCQIVVKFAQTYNVEAHKLCAEQGFAPQLIYASQTVVNEWWMIVMEFLDGMPLYSTETSASEHNAIVRDVEHAITLLHSHDLVFGDKLFIQMFDLDTAACRIGQRLEKACFESGICARFHLKKDIFVPAH